MAGVFAVVLVLGLISLGIWTGALRQNQGDQLHRLPAGQSLSTSLAEVEVGRLTRGEEDIAVEVTITVTADHPVRLNDIVGFRVDGDHVRFFDAEADQVAVETLNPGVPVAMTVSYSPRDGEEEIDPVLLDGVWQTQNDNALALPDHLVLVEPVAVIVE